MLTAQPATSAGSPLRAKLSRSRLRPSNVGVACMAGAGLERVMGSGLPVSGGCPAGSEECTDVSGSASANGVQSVPHRAQRTA